ncbi:MAG: methylated-DNA/protein-cysteine methyltransferase [Acidobacteria bacterium]|nr:methylated-DNA/protein-cysteine methyltransferase [Acidobacteriota bacterium]
MTISDDAAWDAVQRRDARLDGRFVFAVRSTGIYCRPSCPARRPRRENVAFYDASSAAERAGFRACLRCVPDGTKVTLAERVRAAINARIEDGVTLGELAELLGVSAAHLQRTFKQQFGASPKEYLAARRAERFKSELREGKMIAAATYEAGYGSSSRLYSQSNARLGMTPATYRRGGRGMQIRYTTVSTSIGRLLVGITDRGICAVSIGEDVPSLERELRGEYPAASIEQASDPMLDRVVSAVVAQIESRTPAVDLPLDLQATSFQLRVWNALRKIPYGETRTYAEVAAEVGEPKAARAVASACAHNRLALVIPCHRVVPSAGGSGGYRWGAARKKEILEREREAGGSK